MTATIANLPDLPDLAAGLGSLAPSPTKRYARIMTGYLFGLAAFTGLAFAQIGTLYPPTRPAGAGPIGAGFGSVVFPGTGNPAYSQGHIQNLSASIRGVHPTPVAPPPAGGYGYVVPIAMPYPVAYPTPAPAPNITVVNAPQPAPTVIINNTYVPDNPRPVMKDYTGADLPEASNTVRTYQAPIPNNAEGERRPVRIRRETDDKPTIYLLALKDGAVFSCYAYWLEGDTVHYVTTKQAHNKVSRTLVDEKVSDQLNSERNVEFSLE